MEPWTQPPAPEIDCPPGSIVTGAFTLTVSKVILQKAVAPFVDDVVIKEVEITQKISDSDSGEMTTHTVTEQGC